MAFQLGQFRTVFGNTTMSIKGRNEYNSRANPVPSRLLQREGSLAFHTYYSTDLMTDMIAADYFKEIVRHTVGGAWIALIQFANIDRDTDYTAAYPAITAMRLGYFVITNTGETADTDIITVMAKPNFISVVTKTATTQRADLSAIEEDDPKNKLQPKVLRYGLRELATDEEIDGIGFWDGVHRARGLKPGDIIFVTRRRALASSSPNHLALAAATGIYTQMSPVFKIGVVTGVSANTVTVNTFKNLLA